MPTSVRNNGEPILGAHFSIARGLDQAIYTAHGYGCPTLQIFTKNSSSWKEKTLTRTDIDTFREARQHTGMGAIASHTSYLINLAAKEATKRRQSRNALYNELIRCMELDIDFVVLHPGSHMGLGENHGIDAIADGINRVLEKLPPSNTRLLLETTAGQGTGVGHTFDQLAEILGKIERQASMGVCLDTCHIFAAGHDIRTRAAYQDTFRKFSRVLGFDRLFLIHVNDSKKEFGSRVDRHEHIGHGYIGDKGFEHLMQDERLYRIPKILETPKIVAGKDWDKANLARLRRMTKHQSSDMEQ